MMRAAYNTTATMMMSNDDSDGDVEEYLDENNGNDVRPRIIALCGAKSNNEVTKLQLQNLNITEDSYDICEY